jgi:WD40 repeat protein
MRVGLLSFPSVVTALLLAGLSPGDDPPAPPGEDPLPKGSKGRFGFTRPILRKNPSVALLPPAYTNFLAPTVTGGARRYDLGTGRPLDKRGVVGPGRVVVSADGKRAAVARAGALAVLDVATGKELLAVEPPDRVVLSGIPGASLSANGKVLAYGARGLDARGVVVVCDVDKNEVLLKAPAGHTPAFPTISRDGKVLVICGPTPPAPKVMASGKPVPPPTVVVRGDPRAASVWDVKNGKELFKARVTGMGGIVVATEFSADADLVAVSAGDGPVDIWEVRTGKRLTTLLGRKGQGVRVAISPDGKTVASVAQDYRIQRWTVNGKPLGVTDPPPVLVAQLTGLAFADNERVIAWVTAEQFACAWEAPSGKLLTPLSDHLAAVHSTAIPEKGTGMWTSGRDGKVLRWGAPGGAPEFIHLRPAMLPGQPLIRPVVTLTADGTRAVWLRPFSEVFDVATGEDLYGIPPPSVPPTAVSQGVSPDGKTVVTVSRQAAGRPSGSCVVWDLKTQRRVAELDIPPSPGPLAPWAGLSPSGARLVVAIADPTAGGAGALRVTSFDLKTGKKLAEVTDSSVQGKLVLAVANEESVVVSSSSGRVWSIDYAAGKVEPDIEKATLREETLSALSVVFSRDGKRFAVPVVGEPFTTYGVRVYDWPKRKALHTFVGHLGPVTTIRFSPDGKSLATGAEDTSVLLWDLTKGLGPG